MNTTNLLSPNDSSPVRLEHERPVLDVPQLSAPANLSSVRSRRRRIKTWLCRLTLVIFGVLMTLTLIGLGFVLDGALKVKSAMSEGEAAVNSADFAAASVALADALKGLREIKTGLPFLSYLKVMPWVSDQLAGATAALNASIATIEVIQTGIAVADDILETAFGASGLLNRPESNQTTLPYADLTDDEKRLLLASLSSALPDLRDMQVRLRLAQVDLERLDNYQLTPSLSRAVAPLAELVPEFLTVIDILVPVAAIAPEFGGLNNNQQFLVLFLNNAELRPDGGFIGVYSLVEVRDGSIVNMTTGDSYSIDALVQGNPAYHVNPPPPLVSYLQQPVWYFRDAAWSPDFFETAQVASQLMRQEIAFAGQPVPQIDGVIGITPTFVSRFIELTGPITVGGVTFTAENLADELEYQVEQAYVHQNIAEADRKSIVSLLADELMHRLLALPPTTWLDMFHTAHAGVDGKEFALMSFDPNMQAALEDNAWAGVMNPAGADDVLLTVDANLAALKTDLVVDRQVNYSIAKTATGYRGTTSITYTHTGGFDWKTTRYRTYTRVYAPLGSTLVSSSGSLKDDVTRNPDLSPGEVTVADELGMTSFGAFIAIEPGQTGTLSFTYDLPVTVSNAIERGTYRLLALKQMGAGDNLLTLNLNFGNTLLSAVPPEAPEHFGDDLYQVTTELNADKLFTVRLQ